MEMSSSIMSLFDLTGQLTILDYMPKFTGNYSSVYLGGLNGNFVAIKVIKATGGEDSVKRKLLREITLWGSTRHPNIQPFYGFASDQAFGPFGALVSPWCLNGDATHYLAQNAERMVTAERINLWKGAIEGVAYLHNHNPIIIHGDLKPGNILVDDFGVPKICDFGLARVFLQAATTGMTTTSEHTGTTRYLAPELVASEENVYPTTESDVYALGCLGLEFIYDQKPYSNRANNLRGQIVRDIKRNIPPASSKPNQSWACEHAWFIIQQLWDPDPRCRPSASGTVTLLNHAARSLPAIVIKHIVIFSATIEEGINWDSRWIQRTRSLLTLSLVSRSFCACATPFLYQDIRIFPAVTLSRLSSLANTLNVSIKIRHALDDLSSGYGYYTRTCLLCMAQGELTLPPDIQHLLNRMTRLQTLVICTTYQLPQPIPVHSLSTAVFQGVNPLLISDEVTLQVLLPFQRLYVGLVGDPDLLTPDTFQAGQVPLLPNLQDIVLHDLIFWGTSNSSRIFHAFRDWIVPSLNSLHCTLDLTPSSCGAAFIRFFQMQGPRLRYLKLHGTISSSAPPISDLFSLCGNLRSLVVISRAYIDLRSVPPHPKLEILDIEDHSRSQTWEPGGPSLGQFEEFTSSWRARFPKLRMAKFKWHEANFRDNWVEMLFRTENRFYIVNHGEKTYMRRDGKWVGAGMQTICSGDSADVTLLLPPPTLGPQTPFGFTVSNGVLQLSAFLAH